MTWFYRDAFLALLKTFVFLAGYFVVLFSLTYLGIFAGLFKEGGAKAVFEGLKNRRKE